MYKYDLTQSGNGCEVYINLISSSAGLTIKRQPHLLQLVKEVVAKKKLSGPRVLVEQEMGRVIGNSDVVVTTEKDTVFYAQPHKKDVFSRYVKNRSVLPSTQLTIVLQKDEEGSYEIIDTWVGANIPPFPGDSNEADDSRSYWETHALVVDTQVIQPKTITKTSPY